MWWDLLRFPSGDTQAQIYWRRRISVLAVLGVLVVLLLVLVLRGGQGASAASAKSAASQPFPVPSAAAPNPTTPSAAPSAGPSTSAAPATASPSPGTPSGSPTPAAAAGDPASNCTPGSMALRLASDAPSYSAGQQPVLTLSVVDVGTTSCTVDLGTSATSLSVLSGGRPVWTSSACVASVSRPTQLTPAAAKMLSLRWDRTRNGTGQCAAGSSALPAGQYEIVARVGSSAAYGGNFALR